MSQVVILILLVVVVLAVLGGFGWFYLRAQQNLVALGDDLCPQNGALGQTIVLIDTTDQVPDLAARELSQRLQDQLQQIPVGHRLEVRVLVPGNPTAEPIVTKCNPGDGSGQDEWTGNPRKRQQVWNEEFATPVNDAFALSLTSSEADSSPLMAAVQAISVERLTRQADRSIPTHLILVSDMLEHTEAFSMYRQGADWALFDRSEARRLYRTDLAGATVDLILISRPSMTDTAAIASFWAKWTLESGGRFGSAVQLLGAI